MTWQLMKRAGIKGSFEGRKISIPAQKYVSCELNIESDWSAVGYWLNLLVFSKAPGELEFNNLFADSLQGDARLISIFENLGLVFEVSGNGFLVRNTPGFTFPSLLEIDFSDIPDQGQTLMVTCAGLGIEARFSGLESLVIKETNRLKAMQSELGKFGISMDINELEGKCHMAGSQVLKLPTQRIETYEDHRMAMSIAPLAILFSGKLEIENPGVVAKSFPGYWDELAKLGFDLDWEER
jgi:3-phosphoshikimate 1-carboxyvinyltransferase